MKKQILIFVSTLLFVGLFYNQGIGVNLSIFALLLLGLNFVQKPELLHDRKAVVLALCVVLSSFSNAWIFTFTTFISVIISSFIFRYYIVEPQLKLVSQAVIWCSNWLAAFVQMFQFDDWFEYNKSKPQKTFSKLFSYLMLPFLILSVFFGIYVASSDTLSAWYHQYELDVDAIIILITVLGFYFSFVFWNIKVYEPFRTLNRSLQFNFTKQQKEHLKPTFDFLEIGFEKRSGVITLTCLNIMLLFFIIVFNTEHFQTAPQHFSEYSSRIHEQINSLIGSIVLAMLVILFYFKGALNFVQNNKVLVRLSKLWLGLNGAVIISAVVQNTIYINASGLTYKRLGVYLFLILCTFGLYYSYRKIHLQKTNFYLVNKMSWTLFYSLIICSLFNWGAIITKYNLTKENVDLNYLMLHLYGNEKELLKHYQSKKDEAGVQRIKQQIEKEQAESFLSSELYYKSVSLK